MKTKDFFKINGVSSDDFPNLLVNLPPIPPLAERKYNEYDVGGDEVSVIPDNAFGDIKYSIEFITVDVLEYDNSELYKLISEAKTLEISRLDGYYFKVKKAVLAAPTSVYDGVKVKYKLNFVLSPFKYFKDNPKISINSGDVVENRGTRHSNPVIEVAGVGEVTITVNGDKFVVDFGNDYKTVIIDSERLITYYAESKEVLYNRTRGLYPLLAVGQNQIEFTNDFSESFTTDTTLKITLNERSY